LDGTELKGVHEQGLQRDGRQRPESLRSFPLPRGSPAPLAGLPAFLGACTASPPGLSSLLHAYEAHVRRSDGTELEVLVNKDFKVTAVNEMPHF
jgi:hypothetical protein